MKKYQVLPNNNLFQSHNWVIKDCIWGTYSQYKIIECIDCGSRTYATIYNENTLRISNIYYNMINNKHKNIIDELLCSDIILINIIK